MTTDVLGTGDGGTVRVVFREEETRAEAGERIAEPTVGEIKEKIAETVRAAGKERSAMVLAEDVFSLVPDSQQGTITAILEEMASDDRYADIKAVTTASGMVFFFSLTHFEVAQAFAKSRREELKFLVAEKVRADSKHDVKLTAAADLPGLAPELEPDGITALLDEMRADGKYVDIKAVTSPKGEVFYHSDRHMSGYYALVLGRLSAKAPCATIAATVRDESRIYPRPTCLQLFLEPPFQISAGEMGAIVDGMLKKEEYGDIRMLVHPETGAVYLYSSRYLSEDKAFRKMHYVEVVRDANP